MCTHMPANVCVHVTVLTCPYVASVSVQSRLCIHLYVRVYTQVYSIFEIWDVAYIVYRNKALHCYIGAVLKYA